MNVVFGNRAIVDDQASEMRSLCWAPIQYYCCPYKKGRFDHRDRYTQREDEKGQGTGCPSQPQRNQPWSPLSQVSGLQDYEATGSVV